MASVNHKSTRIEKPTVTINAKSVDEITGVIASNASDYTPNRNDVSELVEGGGDYTNTAERVFYTPVTITITPDPKFSHNSYNSRTSGQFVGATGVVNTFHNPGTGNVQGLNIGLNSETYYTLNGKNPKRTKSNLYTGIFTLRRNEEAGSDNLILKTRTYRAGQWSEVRKVEFRIVRNVKTQV